MRWSGARKARLRIVGIAAIGRFAGGAWATADQVRVLAPHGRLRSGSVPLRLRDPGRSAAFAASAPARTHATGVRIGEARIWQADFTDSARRTVTILEATTLLSLLGAGFTARDRDRRARHRAAPARSRCCAPSG